MRLIDADTAAAFAENCGATFVAKRLRDSNAFPEVVTRCKDCKHFNHEHMECENDAVSTDHEGGAQYSLNFWLDDFCSYGERKDEANES